MAQAVHQFQAGHDGGGGPPFDRIDVVSIGGTASAGDLIECVTTGVGGVWDQVPTVEDDVSGATGWTVEFDQTLLGGEDLRIIGWKKTCVGGETTITASWLSPAGGVNHGIVGAWISDPVLPAIQFLSKGNDGSFFGQLHFTNTAPIPSNGATYIGGVGWGNSGVSQADFDPPPSAEGGVGYLTSGNGTGGIQHYNDDGGTTADVLRYIFQPDSSPRVVMYWWATTAAIAELAGEGPLVLGGEGTLTTDGGLVELAGSGGLVLGGEGDLSAASTELAGAGGFVLGGSGTLDVEGGGVNLQGDGPLIVGGSGRLTATLPNPPPGVPDRTDVLGCGIYEAMIFTRGLGEIVGMVPFGQVDWTRVLDDVSTGQLTIDGVANRSQLQRCCRLLGEVNPWEHELAIYRSGYRVWSGPIISMSLPPNQVVINAFDLSAWLGVRMLHELHNAVAPNPGSDLADIWVSYVNDAMSVENSAGLEARVLALTGQLVDRLSVDTDHNIASDAIAELARTGLDWTTIDRVMQGGPLQPQPAPYPGASPYPTLIDESFRVQPTILVDGQQMGNAWSVNASGVATLYGRYGPHYPATVDHVETPAAPDYAAIEAQFGRIERLGQESRILDQASADANAQSRYELAKEPVAVISEGLLLPSAAIPMRKLVPGSIVNVHLVNCCKPIGAPYRIKAVRVSGRGDGSEDVTVEFQPVGTGLTLGA